MKTGDQALYLSTPFFPYIVSSKYLITVGTPVRISFAIRLARPYPKTFQSAARPESFASIRLNERFVSLMNAKDPSIFDERVFVTPSGFKPETFWSVVKCSIQLSYGAIPGPKLWYNRRKGGKYTEKFSGKKPPHSTSNTWFCCIVEHF